MILLVDVDGVLADQVPPVLDRLNREMGYHITKDEIREWDQKIGHTDIKTEIESALLQPEFILSMPLIEGAQETLDTLSKNHKIFIATDRDPATEQYTKQWLKEVGIRYEQFINTVGRGKATLPGDALIDDYWGNIENFAATARLGILFSQPWNSDNEQIESQIANMLVVRAHGWYDVARIINEKS